MRRTTDDAGRWAVTTACMAATAAAVAALAAVGPAPLVAQMEEFLGPHVVETLPYEIPGTGRIGGVTVDAYGYLYVANQDEGVWKIHPSGEVEEFVTGLYGSGGGTMLPNGDLLHAAYNGDWIVRVKRDGTVVPFVDQGLEGPVAMVLVGDAVYVPQAKSNWIARITLDGEVSEFVRDDRLRIPNGITTDGNGNLYVVSLGNTVVLRVDAAGEVTEVATLPGTANAHVAFAQGALYVTQIWENVILRVGMDGSYQVVAGDGTLGSRAGGPDESQVPFPNGIVASPRGDVLYFNTLEGNMVSGAPGVIRVHELHVPNPNAAFVRAWRHGGLGALREKFEMAQAIEQIPAEQRIGGLYASGRHMLNRGMTEAGLALTDWTAETDPNEVRRNMMRGRVHFVHGDPDVARSSLERVVELVPDDPNAQRMLEAARTYGPARSGDARGGP